MTLDQRILSDRALDLSLRSWIQGSGVSTYVLYDLCANHWLCIILSLYLQWWTSDLRSAGSLNWGIL